MMPIKVTDRSDRRSLFMRRRRIAQMKPPTDRAATTAGQIGKRPYRVTASQATKAGGAIASSAPITAMRAWR